MFFAIITLVTALAMAVTAAAFAIFGIMAVFAGAPIPALIMGTVIELGKLVGVSWIYRHWKERTTIKVFMLPAVIVAMFLTSMGIFGFLSKAHLEQTTPVGNNTAQIERLDQRIAREQAKIDDADTVIQQLDTTVSTLIEYDKISGPDGARAVRAGQQEQRDALANTIDQAENKISEYQDERFELSSKLRDLELEVGPVKYLAALVYDDPASNMERAVRFVIIAFIFVFDPMAILLLMGANFSFMKLKKDSSQLDDSEDEDPEEFYVNSSSIKGAGEDLINLIDDTYEDPGPEILAEDSDVNSEEIHTHADRAWLKNIPKKDENVDNEILFSTIKKLRNRDLTKDEQALLDRFRKLASARGIPWDVAQKEIHSRAAVNTQNDLLKS